MQWSREMVKSNSLAMRMAVIISSARWQWIFMGTSPSSTCTSISFFKSRRGGFSPKTSLLYCPASTKVERSSAAVAILVLGDFFCSP